MPIFLDRHDLTVDLTPEQIGDLHAKDLAVQGDHGVNFMTYWCDPTRKCAFCLVEAPDAETAIEVHRRSHGETPTEIIPVEISAVMAFLGRILDPARLQPGEGFLESAYRTVMFTDIVNSMEMTARLGDAQAMEMTRAHDGIVRHSLAKHNGREVKHTGDGIMAAFDRPQDAVRCACACQSALRDFNAESGQAPLHLRIGIHSGAPVEDSRDLFGQTVQVAARICADASVDAVVVSERVREELDDEFHCASLGKRMLKGVPTPLAVFAVDWER